MIKNILLKLSLIFFLATQIGCSSAKRNNKEKEDYVIYIPTRPVKNNHPKGKLDLYVGARNYITIIPHDKNLKLDVSISNGIIEKDEHSKYNYNIFTKNFKRSYLLVKHNDKLDTITFFKYNIPPPILRYKVKSIGTLSSKGLKDFTGFMASLPDFNYDSMFEVYSMDLIIIDNDSNQTENFENLANKSPMLKKLMRQAKPNDVYIFHNVKIKVMNTEDVIIRGESIVSQIIE